MEVSNKKTQRVKVTQYDPLYLLSTCGQQEGEHGCFKSLCDSEWSKSQANKPISKFLGLSLSTQVWLALKRGPSFVEAPCTIIQTPNTVLQGKLLFCSKSP